MARFYFNLDVNGRLLRDTTGRELADLEDAKKRADDVIYDLLRIWDRAQALDCACTVHDGQGGQVYRHSLLSNAFTPEAADIVDERKARRAAARALAGPALNGRSGRYRCLSARKT